MDNNKWEREKKVSQLLVAAGEEGDVLRRRVTAVLAENEKAGEFIRKSLAEGRVQDVGLGWGGEAQEAVDALGQEWSIGEVGMALHVIARSNPSRPE